MPLVFLMSVAIGCQNNNTSTNTAASPTQPKYAYKGTGSPTQGSAKTKVASLLDCEMRGSRIAAVGEIRDASNKSWTVPGINHFQTAVKAFDLYNDCTGVTPENIKQVNLDNVPITEIDSGGEIITGYIFADNYFELYINGALVAIDPVPFTPFNSNVVKFRVEKPYTIALRLIDWEENLGLGSERNRGSDFHPGDGGVIASFSDGTITNDQWKAQTFYTAPIHDLSCLSEVGGQRLSSSCHETAVKDGKNLYGVHWKMPENTFDPSFDDGIWPLATTYTEEVIGVDNKKAYMNFREKFTGAGAEFIWSTNVILDNEVVVRYTVE